MGSYLGALVVLLGVLFLVFWVARKLFKTFSNKIIRAIIVLISSCSILILIWVMCLVSFGGLFAYCAYLSDRDYDIFKSKITPSVSWVKDDFPIYFVKGAFLYKVNVNGKGLEKIFKANDLIYRCEFSPDGKYLAVMTIKDRLDLFNVENNKFELIGSLGNIDNPYKLYDIPNVRLLWALDSRSFIFKVLYPKGDGPQNNYYVYNYVIRENKLISSMPLDILKLKGNIEADSFFEKGNESGSRDWNFVSNNGSKVFENKNYYVCYQDANGKIKNLGFKFPRGVKGIGYIKCFLRIPGDRYAIFNFEDKILVLELSTSKMGKLVDGDFFGWYQGNINKE